MSATLNLASNPVVGSKTLSATADSSYTAPTHTVALLTATAARQLVGSVTTGTYTLTSSTLHNGDVGRSVTGSGIPTGTTIVSVVTGTSAKMSKKATASHATEKVTLGGGSGMIVIEVDVVGAGATVAGMCNIFLKDPAGTFHFRQTIKVTAVTPSSSTVPFGATPNIATGKWLPPNLVLPPNWVLCATSFVASQLANVIATGGAF